MPMRIRFVLVVLVLAIFTQVASAQLDLPTATPTADPSCTDPLRIIGHIIFGPGCVGNGQPITMEDSMKSDFYRNMATAAAIVNSLPEKIQKAGPNNQTLAEAMEGAKQVFGYVKWLFSPNSAQELLGRSLAPIAINVMAVMTMYLAMVAIYITTNMAIYIVKLAIWLMTQLLKLLPFW